MANRDFIEINYRDFFQYFFVELLTQDSLKITCIFYFFHLKLIKNLLR